MVGIWQPCEDDNRAVLISDGRRIVGANEKALELFRATPDQIIGTDVRHWIIRENRKIATARLVYLPGLAIGEEMPPLEYTFVRLDGSCFYAVLYIKRFAENIFCGSYRYIAEVEA